ncbi:MAG: ABC transporter ATP-binding protein [Actinomycetota bacterium]
MSMVSAEFFAPDMRDALARLRHVYKVYRIGDTGVVALGGVDLDVERGEFLAVVGPSGAGKSTILNLLGGLDRASAGSVEVDGRDLGLLSDDELTRYRAERVGFVWQGTAAQPGPVPSVRENVRLPSALHEGVATDRRRGADELLRLVGLGERARTRSASSSGGEQQRAAIAVALSNTPAFLLADEPTAELDSVSASAVMDAFRAVNREFGVTIVMVTHDLAAARRADRRSACATAASCTRAPRSHPSLRTAASACRRRRWRCWAAASSRPRSARTRCACGAERDRPWLEREPCSRPPGSSGVTPGPAACSRSAARRSPCTRRTSSR